MGIFDVFKKRVKEKSVTNGKVSVQVQKKQPKESASKGKTLYGKPAKKPEKEEKLEITKVEPSFAVVSSGISHEKTHQKLDGMDKKLDELLEIKVLYNDMLDWLVELARHSKTQRDGERVDVSAMVSDKSEKLSILSPRLRQILDIVEERGEVLADDVSSTIGLSLNRSSELLNALHRANYVEKNRAGRKVFYRKISGV